MSLRDCFESMENRPKANKDDVLTLKPLVVDTLNTGPPTYSEKAYDWLLIHHPLTLMNSKF